jgi:Ni/Fe-hydrogenase subunit HybB-like protein
MIEKALKGNRTYWIWIISLLSVMAFGISAYAQQMRLGLSVTGLGNHVSWGLSIMQFTIMAALSASTVVVVLPFYLHNYKPLGKIVVIAQLLAVTAAATALLFLFIDMGKPQLIFDLVRYANPHSLYAVAFFLLNAFLLINLVSSWATLGAERKDVPVAAWVKPLIYLSIPLAIAIPVITGLFSVAFPANLWFASLLAPRLLASAFAGGTALLVLIILLLKRTTAFDAGKEVTNQLTLFIIYTGSLNFLLTAMDYFVGTSQVAPFMWFSLLCGIASITVLLVPTLKSSTRWLALASAGVALSIWAEKGAALLHSPTGEIIGYIPTLTEISVTLGALSFGLLMLTMFLKVAVTVKTENER